MRRYSIQIDEYLEQFGRLGTENPHVHNAVGLYTNFAEPLLTISPTDRLN